MLGSKPAEIPWMRCFPFCPLEMNGASSGSTPIISTSLFTSFNARPTPVIVPPVPIPLIYASGVFPSKALMISCPVV